MDSAPLMYSDLAGWWPLVSDPTDYREEAEFALEIFQEPSRGPIREVLELGCGGGNNASHLKARLVLTLTDLSPNMLEVSRALNPECEHRLGDMRSLRLGRLFDAVFAHDALSYLTTEAEIRQTLETANAHLRSGGTLVLVPDWFRENFIEKTELGGEDGEGKSLRYLQWRFDPDPDDTTVEIHFAYMLRSGGRLETLGDRHVCGLFPRAVWIESMREEGFEVESRPDPWSREWLIGKKR